MSIVNLKIIFVKKEKADTRTFNSRPGRDIYYNRNSRFHTREGLFVYSETGYPFDDSPRQIGNTS